MADALTEMMKITGVSFPHAFRAAVFARAKAIGWDGDIREGPYVAGLPYEERDIIVAWKQDNNGRTFVAAGALAKQRRNEWYCRLEGRSRDPHFSG